MRRLSLLAILFLVASLVKAQNNLSGNNTASDAVTVKLKDVKHISIASNLNATSFDFDDISKYEAGIEVRNASVITYKTNKVWTLSVKADASTFNGVTGSTPLAISVLAFKNHTDGTYVTMQASNQTVASGTKGNNTVSVDYKVTPGFNYDSGDYMINLTYTLSNP